MTEPRDQAPTDKDDPLAPTAERTIAEQLEEAAAEVAERVVEIDAMGVPSAETTSAFVGGPQSTNERKKPLSEDFLRKCAEALKDLDLGDNPTSNEAEAMDMSRCDPAIRQCRIGSDEPVIGRARRTSNYSSGGDQTTQVDSIPF